MTIVEYGGRGWGAFVGLLLLAAPLSPARAEGATDVTACRTEREPERGIEACSRVIADASLPASARAAALQTRGHIYGRTRRRDLALLDFTQAIEIEPQNPLGYRTRGYAYSTREDFDRALADYGEAIRLDPQDAGAYRERGDVRLIQRHYEEARADYATAIRLKPDSGSFLQCQASASLPNAFFHCTHVTLDDTQPEAARALAQRRLDDMMGRAPRR
jgi:tetratricopeptide (TPR) repeat protein